MKRMRTIDVPKFRRSLKNRARPGESVYFSLNNLVYLKFILMWIGCITIDFVIGFRFELLWPIWLLVRHIIESCRANSFSSQFHYSVFSVFFVCVTATSDLVCYLFIPIQLLLFLASTYVWLQFVYQSSEKGLCLSSLLLYALFLVFEYSMRYKFDNAKWYLTRSSWLTVGLFPSTADNVPVGTTSNFNPSQSFSTHLELYKPFAAHCIGFPVVTLGFRVKSLFSSWRARLRREEVGRQNEFFERLLADAVPIPFENRQHFISSSRRYLTLDHDVLDNENSSSFSSPELLDNNAKFFSLISSTNSLINNANNSLPLAICKNQLQSYSSNNYSVPLNINNSSINNTNTTQTTFTSRKNLQKTSATSSQMNVFHRRNIATVKQNNNYLNSNSSIIRKRSLSNTSDIIDNNSRKTSYFSSSSRSLLYRVCKILIITKLLQLLLAFTFAAIFKIYQRILNPFFNIFKDVILSKRKHIKRKQSLSKINLTNTQFSAIDSLHNRTIQNCHMNNLLQSNIHNQLQNYEFISINDVDLHVADDYDEIEELEDRLPDFLSPLNLSASLPSTTVNGVSGNTIVTTNININQTTSTINNKKKLRRTRNRTPAVSNESKDSLFVQNTENFSTLNNEAQRSNNFVSTHNGLINSEYNTYENDNITQNGNNQTIFLEKCITYNGNTLGDNLNAKILEIKQLSKDKEMLKNSLEKLTNELKLTRSDVLELRTQLSQTQQQERISRSELTLYKNKMEQLETKHKQVLKQNENFKTNISSLEKKIGELQSKKIDLERELINERQNASLLNLSVSNNKHNNYYLNKEELTHSTKNEYNHLKSKILELERELKVTRRELRLKDEINLKVEEDLRQLRLDNITKEELNFKKLESLRQKNYLLEQTLSSENRFKQDLFRALNDSKAQIETLTNRLQIYEKSINGICDSINVQNEFFVKSIAENNQPKISRQNSPLQQNPQITNNYFQLLQKQQTLNNLHFVKQKSVNCSSYNSTLITQCTTQKSVTPPVDASGSLGLEKLMHSTKTQHMSYSLTPFETTRSSPDQNNAVYENVGLDNSFENIVGLDQKKGLTVGGHRNNNLNISNYNNNNSLSQRNLLMHSPLAQIFRTSNSHSTILTSTSVSQSTLGSEHINGYTLQKTPLKSNGATMQLENGLY